MTWTPGRRVVIAIGLSLAMCVVIAALFPRVYLANDDIGFTEYLRKNTFTPWISPILSRGFGFAYQEAPGVPWYGLYQYALIVATGAVLIHTCTELIDQRPGAGQIATWVGAVVIGASHAILVIGITWTTVSISALGTAAAAFVAHAQICQADDRPVSRLRAVVYGLVFVSGYMLRLQGLGAVAVALVPLVAWAAWWFARRRALPRPTAVLGFVAPFVLVFAIQDHTPTAKVEDMTWFNRFNNERGKIHGHTAFEGLDTRAPQLLARAGWTLEEYRDFTSWLIIDEDDYPIDKVERLLATGGVPEELTPAWGYRQLRGIYDDSTAAVCLFLCMVAAGVVLALLEVIPRARSLAFCLGYLGFLIAVPLWMSAHFRFPQRVSLAFYTVAALGVFLYLARTIADRPDDADRPLPRPLRAGAIAIAACLLGWAWHLAGWVNRTNPWPYRAELQALEDRVAARGGFVFVYVQAGLVELDPLRAEPRSYDGLQGGWGTFSAVWYETIHRLGVRRGADLLRAMVDNPEAYLLAPVGASGVLEDWIHRKVHDDSVRLALVDGAAFRGGGRPELYRLVTAPLARGSEEWRARARDEWAAAEALPGPPSVSGLAFHPVPLAAPYEPHVSSLRNPPARIRLEPIDGGVRAIVTGEAPDGCAVTGDDPDSGAGPYAGIHVPVHGLRAARFGLTLIDPENILGFHVYARSQTSRSVRWRWRLDPPAQEFGYTGTITLVPGYPARRLGLAVNTARPRDLRDLDIFLVVKPGTQASFELRNFEISEP
jgi:hypothetical protein